MTSTKYFFPCLILYSVDISTFYFTVVLLLGARMRSCCPPIITFIFSENICVLFFIILLKKKRQRVINSLENSLPPIFKASGANLADLLVTNCFFNTWCLIPFYGTTSMGNISYPIYTIWLDYKCNQNALLSTFTALLAFQFCNAAKEYTTHIAHTDTRTRATYIPAPCECPNTFLFSET